MEVIDLISSSPPAVAVRPPRSKEMHEDIVQKLFSFSSDGVDPFGDVDFPMDQPAKKQKMNHITLPPLRPQMEAGGPRQQVSVDLSSDQDILPSTQALLGRGPQSMYTTTSLSVPAQISSSAPEPSRPKSSTQNFVLDLSSDSESAEVDLPEDYPTRAEPVFSQQTTTLLANLRAKPSGNNLTKSKFRRIASAQTSRAERFQTTSTILMDDVIESSQPEQSKPVKPRAARVTKEGNQPKSSAQKISKEQREAEKEAERQRKKQEKEDRQKEKQKAADIAEVNKSKTNKKNSTPEMIMQMPSSLKGLSVCNQVEEYMKELGVQLNFIDDDVSSGTLQEEELKSGSIISWKRKVTAEYDEDHELWQPLAQPRVSNEDHILIYIKAEELMNIAVAGKSSTITNAADVSEEIIMRNIDDHITNIRSQYRNCRLLYLIEGLAAWLRKSASAKNRAYTAAVRAQPTETANVDLSGGDGIDDDDEGTRPASTQRRTKTTTSRRKKPSTKPQIDFSSITETTTEALLLHMQLHHQPLLIHHTTSPKTSAAQISTFTQHLSTRPYRLAAQNANLASASFCMTTGQIRTGTTADETWLQMLQEITRVTPSMAYGIVGAGYTNPSVLVQAFQKDGRLMLEDVRKSTNKDGGWSDRRLGPMVSKRIHKVFMGKDPTAMDGMA